MKSSYGYFRPALVIVMDVSMSLFWRSMFFSMFKELPKSTCLLHEGDVICERVGQRYWFKCVEILNTRIQ